MTNVKTWKDFPYFYSHPMVQKLAPNKRWTVSDKNKIPIDIQTYISKNIIVGAAFMDEKSLVDLGTLCRVIPSATNNAYYLDSLQDNIVCLDIEPKCPDHIKNKFLNMPFLYGEVSMSGKGLHLFFELPTLINNYPNARNKIVMKEEHGWYEILMCHYVTFTRNIIPVPTTPTESFENIFESLAKKQKPTSTAKDVDISDTKPEPSAYHDKIMTSLAKASKTYKKTLDDFHGDESRYEFGYIGFLYAKLKQITKVIKHNQNIEISVDEMAWMLYETAEENLPYRLKHDEIRDGKPWLLYLAQNIISKS